MAMNSGQHEHVFGSEGCWCGAKYDSFYAAFGLVHGNFQMRGYGPGEINVYDCADCKASGTEHTVSHESRGHTGDSSSWGPGIPKTIRVCSGCGRGDGPWVSAEIVGGCW